MKTIPLTRGQVALVDDADFAALSAYTWYAHLSVAGTFYATRHGPGPRYKTIAMHQDILSGAVKVDHKNRNTLDNQRHNLRPASHSQNIANSGLRRDSITGFKGVSWRKDRRMFIARIRVTNRRYSLGFFSEAWKAAQAYDAEARQQFGEFACVNFPRETSK